MIFWITKAVALGIGFGSQNTQMAVGDQDDAVVALVIGARPYLETNARIGVFCMRHPVERLDPHFQGAILKPVFTLDLSSGGASR